MPGNPTRARIGGALAMVGGALWALSWTFNLQTAEGTRAVLGLSEPGWRRLLDPALMLVIVGLFAYRKQYSWPGSRTATVGWAVAVLGLITAVIGNVIEFWIGPMLYVDVPGQSEPTDLPGWGLFLVGVMIFVPLGFILLGLAQARSPTAPGWRQRFPLLMGVLGAALAVVAFLAQDALGPVLLTFALGWVMLGYDVWSSARRAA